MSNKKHHLFKMHKNIGSGKHQELHYLTAASHFDKILKKNGSSGSKFKDQKNLRKGFISSNKNFKTSQPSSEKYTKAKNHNPKAKSLKKSNSKESSESGERSMNYPEKANNIYTKYGQNEKQYELTDQLTDKSFENVAALKLTFLSYIFKKRIVKDEQYNELYEKLIDSFPNREEMIKGILFQIVSALDN